MATPLIQKLEHAGDLDDADRAALRALSATTRHVAAHCDVNREGDQPETVSFVLEGFAYRYRTLINGKRQILGLLLPGDFCDLNVAILARRDHSVATFGPSDIAQASCGTISALTAGSLNLARAFWWATLVEESILREWL